MTRFRLRELRVENYRCFEALTLPLEDDTSVLFAENGGGKTALLTAMAMGLAVFQRGAPKSLKLDPRSDPRMRTLDDKGRREPTGPCKVAWTAAVGETESVEWSTTVEPGSGRTTSQQQPIFEAIERVRVPGDRWPLFAWYGVDRMRRGNTEARPDDLELVGALNKLIDGIRNGDVSLPPDDREMEQDVELLDDYMQRVHWSRPRERTNDRWDAYTSALDPSLDDAPLLRWLQDEMLGDVARKQQGQPERFFHKAVMEATVRATPGVVNAWYDPVEQSPMVCFEDGHVAPWSELSDGYHEFIALVADIARRAVMLNEIDGAEAPARVEGLVLIDELDLHLHPRWQRVALPRLRAAFPRLQLVVTTHSPQVLSSAENRQVRRLFDGKLQQHDVFVQGRDSNAILRELMHTDDRDEEGARALRELYEAMDRGDRVQAERIYANLLARWGDRDPELIRAKGFMEQEPEE